MRNTTAGRGAQRPARRRHRAALDDDRQQDRWLISYADLITLLFALFVVMYAASTVHEEKYRTLSAVLGNAFGNSSNTTAADLPEPPQTAAAEPVAATAPEPTLAIAPARPELRPIPGAVTVAAQTPAAEPVDDEIEIEIESEIELVSELVSESVSEIATESVSEIATESVSEIATESVPVTETEPATEVAPDGTALALVQLFDGLQNNVAELVDAELVTVRRNGSVIEVEIREQLLFDSGSAAIGERAIAPIGKIAALLRDQPYAIQVAGYTDNIPINTAIYPSNWELSAARAASVVHLLMNAGVRPERMSAVGYGEYRPVADNSNEQGRSRNRRVVLVIGDEPVPASPSTPVSNTLAQN